LIAMAIDPYRTLGLEPGATPAEVKRAYRRLAKAFHPDSAGEAALPRFLAIHEAYDQLTTGRRPASGGRAGSTAPAEPWRADPARARAAREQARSRRPRAGSPGAGTSGSAGASSASDGSRRRAGTVPGSPGPGASRTGPAGRTTGTGGAARGTSGAGSGSSARAGSGSSRGGAASARPAGRRRTVRKATLGSTSYDEARDPADPTWAGAAWYGPTSGEYWTVNPREYADPRKHGPEYQSRARRGATTAGGAESGSGPNAEAGAYRQTGPAAAGTRAWTPPEFGESAEASAKPDRGPTEPRTIVPPASLASFLGSDLGDPVRRLGFVLLAWAPLGVAAAAIIGQMTGCASYSASCGATEPLLPWLAQAIILGVLLLVPALSRILATGTIALVLALVPIAGVFVGFGGAGQTEGSVLLVVLLTAAWVAGVAVAVRSAWRSRAGRASI
jgi:curved DNA-binding protein CbpA